MSTSFASTEWITTGFLKQFSTGMANSIFDKWHTSKIIDPHGWQSSKASKKGKLWKNKETEAKWVLDNVTKQKKIKANSIAPDPWFEYEIRLPFDWED